MSNNTHESARLLGKQGESASRPARSGQQQGGATNEALKAILDRMRLPTTLKRRLERDAYGGTFYRRLTSAADIEAQESNSSAKAFACCGTKTLVNQGTLGRLEHDGIYSWLAPGYHLHGGCCDSLSYHTPADVAELNAAQRNGPLGFVTVTEGHVGILTVSGEYRLLAPGTYEWSSPAVHFEKVVNLTSDQLVHLGPYTLVSVPAGFAAVTFDNGRLRVLGSWERSSSTAVAATAALPALATSDSTPRERTENPLVSLNHGEAPTSAQPQQPPATVNQPQSATATGEEDVQAPGGSAAFFLDDPCWTFSSYLSLRTRTDTLEGNNLLSKDNVELLMTAMSHWRIVDPVLAITRCGKDMEQISTKINALIRATIARIVAGTNIGAGPVSGGVAKGKVVQAAVLGSPEDDAANNTTNNNNATKDDANLAYLMQSEQATKHMMELTSNTLELGVEVAGVYVPEKRMKNDDVRREIASQAVIGIKADAERSAADARAYATVQASRADAEATVTAAKAQAEAVEVLAAANEAAGKRLGEPNSTAARLALTAATSKALEGAKLTVFNGGSMEKLPFMFTEKME